MSAFVCSDTHFAVVAKLLFDKAEDSQKFADLLKRENIRSVNHRYSSNVRFRKVDLKSISDADLGRYSLHDALKLLECIDYQSCEPADYNNVLYELASSLLIARGARSSQASVSWSI